MDNNFNQSLNNLPNSIQSLVLGKYFNHSLDYLPNSIKNLVVGNCFSHPINKLPISIENLTILGNDIKLNIKNLPKSIKQIKFFNNKNNFKLFVDKFSNNNNNIKFNITPMFIIMTIKSKY